MPAYTEDQAARERERFRAPDAMQQQTLPVVEERLALDKQPVEKGGVRVRQYVDEQPVTQNVSLNEEHVSVERRPVDEPVDPNARDVFKEGTIEIREMAEVPVARKDAHVVEEVVIDKNATPHAETVQDTVRRTHVDVQPLEGSRTPNSPESLDRQYRDHFARHYGDRGLKYDQYAPAYQYGSRIAADPAAQGLSSADVEPRIRERWEGHNSGTWDQYRDAVR